MEEVRARNDFGMARCRWATKEVALQLDRPKVVETRTLPRTLYGFVLYDPRRLFPVSEIDLINPEFVGVPDERRVFFYGSGCIIDENDAPVKQLDDTKTIVSQSPATPFPSVPTYVLFHNQVRPSRKPWNLVLRDTRITVE